MTLDDWQRNQIIINNLDGLDINSDSIPKFSCEMSKGNFDSLKRLLWEDDLGREKEKSKRHCLTSKQPGLAKRWTERSTEKMVTDDAMDVESNIHTHNLYMDVDSRQQQTIPQAVIDDAIAEARQTVISFLRSHSSEEIVPTNSRVVILDSTIRLRHAFRALIENDVRAAPIVDLSTREYVSMLTASDGLDTLLSGRGAPGDMSTVGSLRTTPTSVSTSATTSRGLRCAKATDSLLAACVMMRDDGLHRVPIESDRMLLCVLDYGRVLRFVHGHLATTSDDDSSGSGGSKRLLSLTIEQLALGNFSDIVTMRETDLVIDVLRTLQTRGLRAIPIVNSEGLLTNVYSRSDAVLLAGGEWGPGVLEGSVKDMLKQVRDPSFFVVTCRRSDCLSEVFQRFESSRRHRLYIIDDAGSVIGVLSLGDLLRYFLEGY